jgi:DNA-binding GntR family transcriptional regulator
MFGKLEPLSIRRAATRITSEELVEAQRLVKSMESETDPAAWVELNSHFHAVLEAAAKAPLIQSLLKSIRDIAAIYVAHSLIIRPSRIASGNKEHRALLAAVRRHDADLAAELMVAHLNSTLELILESQSEIFPAADGAKAGRAHRFSGQSAEGRPRARTS